MLSNATNQRKSKSTSDVSLYSSATDVYPWANPTEMNKLERGPLVLVTMFMNPH